MNFPQHPDDVEDPFHGTPQQEAHAEMVQIFGSENPDREWILTDYDVWEKNPYFIGTPTNIHPEDDQPMNLLHFSKLKNITAKEAGQPEDSGNGYYSYSYYILPFTGVVDTAALRRIQNILFKRYYNPPFLSLGRVEVASSNGTSGTILFSTTYHHGD